MKAVNIDWSITPEEAYSVLEEKPYEKTAEFFGVSKERWANMNGTERADYAEDAFRHSPGLMSDFMLEFLHLPTEVEIPKEAEDDVTEWLSDTYGYFVDGYSMEM